MASVTLFIPDDLLKRRRSEAQARGTSLNALVRELLDETVSNPGSAVDSMIERLRQSAGDSKSVKIHREELQSPSGIRFRSIGDIPFTTHCFNPPAPPPNLLGKADGITRLRNEGY